MKKVKFMSNKNGWYFGVVYDNQYFDNFITVHDVVNSNGSKMIFPPLMTNSKHVHVSKIIYL